ncbi:hypothetical protein F5Y00DRAFT_226820 [Daldinia vernicosa]|uniref:uncharacterized protein n=1 Tax=Daldinia vernicosa TaxID=114800 RepID=UPI002008723A|nr:uncharacterized protein F5Y00DRAFT_226820 [Daldinia vernicosa]KAI0852513.1 hypothetical protein F5Y00DRAFT_226820 [Daldinia vernicosa]
MATSHTDVRTARFKVDMLDALEALPLSNGDSSDNPNELGNAIRKWTSNRPTTPLLYALQDSSDMDPSMDPSIDSLTPPDSTRFCCLQSLESQCHFHVFITQIEKREIGTEADIMGCGLEESEEDALQHGTQDIEVIEWSVRLDFDIWGNRKSHSLDIKSDLILQGDVFIDCEPDEDGYLPEGYDEPVHPGMRGFCRYYRSLALLIVPQATMLTYVLSNFLEVGDISAIADILEYISLRCNGILARDSMYFGTLADLCGHFFSQRKARTYVKMELPESTITEVLRAALLFEDHCLFELVCNNIEVNLSSYFFLWIAEKLQGSKLPLTTLRPAFDRSVLGRRTLGDQYRYILSLNLTCDETPKELRELALNALDKMVQFCYTSTLYEQDGETLVLIASNHRGYDWLLTKLGPLVSNRHDSIAFVLGFSWQLYVNARQGRLEVSDSFEFLKDTIKSLIARLDVVRLISEQGFQLWQSQRALRRGGHTRLNQDAIPLPPPPVTSNTLLNLCRLLFDLDMESDLRDLARRLVEQSERIDLLELVELYVPFVGGFMDLLGSRSISVEDPAYLTLIRTIIQSFWTRYIVMEEQIPTQAEQRQTSNQRLAKFDRVKRVEKTRQQLATLNQRSLSIVLGRDYYNMTGNEAPYSEYPQPDLVMIEPYAVPQPYTADSSHQPRGYQIGHPARVDCSQTGGPPMFAGLKRKQPRDDGFADERLAKR